MKLEFESNAVSSPLVGSQIPTEVEQNESSQEVLNMLKEGIAAAQAGDRAEARTFLMKVTEVEPKNENAWLWLASISEYPEELLVFLNNVLQINPDNERAKEWSVATKSLIAKTFVQRGIDAAKDDQARFAKQCFLQAIVHDPDSELAWLWLASVSESTDEKISHLQKVLQINPANENAKSSLKSAREQTAKSLLPKANSAAISGDREQAAELLTKIFSSAPDFEDAWMLKAHISDSFADKITAFERVLEINPENQVARANVESLKMFEQNQDGANSEPTVGFEGAKYDHEEASDEAPEPTAVTEAFDADSFEAESAPVEFDSADSEVESYETSDNLDVEQEPVAFEDVAHAVADHPEEAEEAPVAEDVSFDEAEEEEAVSFDSEAEEEVQFQAEEPIAESLDHDYQEEAVDVADEEDTLSFEADENYSNDQDEDQPEAQEDLSVAVEEALFDSDESVPSYEEEAVEEAEFEVQVEAETEVEVQAEAEVEAEAEQHEEHQFESNQDAGTPDVHQEEEQVEEAPAEAEMSAESEVEMPAEEEGSSEPTMPSFESQSDFSPEMPADHNQAETCPYCDDRNDAQAFACQSCRAIFTVSDLDMILDHTKANEEVIAEAVKRMEESMSVRGVVAEELKYMGIGYLNLKDFSKGLDYLREAVQRDPSDTMLATQVEALADKVQDIEAQKAVHDSEDGVAAKKILVVDDSPTVRKLISGKLEKCGHEPISAVDGMDALAKINEVIPDLILLDITMPRMDGYQVCKLIRSNEATKDVPVVMISGKDGFFDKVRGKMAGTSNYITKPFGPETLMKTVNEYIG